MHSLRPGAATLLLAAILTAGPQPWRKDPKLWAKEDVQHVLNESPWAQNGAAAFPDPREAPGSSVYDLPGAAQAGLPAPKNAATDGHWDGGVGKNNGAGMLPTLSVLIRWDSALPVRQALLRSRELGVDSGSNLDAAAALHEPANYVLTIVGLIPAHQYNRVGTLTKRSTSEADDTTRPPLDTEQILEGLMASTRLLLRGKPAIRPNDVKLDAATGVLHVFFPRTANIQKSDKEVVFATRFGSLSVEKRFRLSEMVYQKRLEL